MIIQIRRASVIKGIYNQDNEYIELSTSIPRLDLAIPDNQVKYPDKFYFKRNYNSKDILGPALSDFELRAQEAMKREGVI